MMKLSFTLLAASSTPFALAETAQWQCGKPFVERSIGQPIVDKLFDGFKTTFLHKVSDSKCCISGLVRATTGTPYHQPVFGTNA